MSIEDRQLDCLCERNNRRRKWAEEAELEETLHRQAQEAERRAERRRVHYRTVMPVMFFLGGMSVVTGVWLYWMYEHSLACLLAFGMAGILAGYGFHFDDRSRRNEEVKE